VHAGGYGTKQRRPLDLGQEAASTFCEPAVGEILRRPTIARAAQVCDPIVGAQARGNRRGVHAPPDIELVGDGAQLAADVDRVFALQLQVGGGAVLASPHELN
jgi:hypothetical protein